MLSFAADRIGDGDLTLIFALIAVAFFLAALYLAAAVHQYVGAGVCAVIGAILLILTL